LDVDVSAITKGIGFDWKSMSEAQIIWTIPKNLHTHNGRISGDKGVFLDLPGTAGRNSG